MKPSGLVFTTSLAMLAGSAALEAADWPQWMGSQRDDVWREQGIFERFPSNGPPVLWRVPIAPSYSGPASYSSSASSNRTS